MKNWWDINCLRRLTIKIQKFQFSGLNESVTHNSAHSLKTHSHSNPLSRSSLSHISLAITHAHLSRNLSRTSLMLRTISRSLFNQWVSIRDLQQRVAKRGFNDIRAQFGFKRRFLLIIEVVGSSSTRYALGFLSR